jgi:hypothetical protein
MVDDDALVRRILTLLRSWRLTFEQVDEILCLKQGTAERLAKERKWVS